MEPREPIRQRETTRPIRVTDFCSFYYDYDILWIVLRSTIMWHSRYKICEQSEIQKCKHRNIAYGSCGRVKLEAHRFTFASLLFLQKFFHRLWAFFYSTDILLFYKAVLKSYKAFESSQSTQTMWYSVPKRFPNFFDSNK